MAKKRLGRPKGCTPKDPNSGLRPYFRKLLKDYKVRPEDVSHFTEASYSAVKKWEYGDVPMPFTVKDFLERKFKIPVPAAQ